MILFLIFVKQMAYIAVIFSKQCATMFTTLLGVLEFFTADALHFLYFETVQLVVFTAVVTQPARIELVTTRCLKETAPIVVLAAPPPSLQAADAIFPRRRRHLHLPSRSTKPSPSLEATPRNSGAALTRLLLAAAATAGKMVAAHVTRGSRVSGSCSRGRKRKEALAPSPTLVAVFAANGNNA